MPIVRNKKQSEMLSRYKKLQKEFKRKGIPMGMFDYVFHKIAVEMKQQDIESIIKNTMKEMVDM